MPDLNELREQLRKLEDVLRLKLPEIVTLISLSAKAFAERNIKESGFGATYSHNEVPAWFFRDKELNNAGEAFVNKKIQDDEGMYWAELRAAQGLQTAHVDLTYRGIMWAGMLPEEAFEEGGIFRAPLAGGNKEVQNEMNWNRDRYGDFIGKALTPENFGTLLQVAYDEIIQLIEDSGLKLNKQ